MPAAAPSNAVTWYNAERVAQPGSVLLREWSAKVQLANDPKALKDVGKGITPQLKSQMLPSDVAALREVYQAREAEIGKAGVA